MSASRLDAVLRQSPAQWLFRKRVRHRVVVLAYHDVADPERFRDQIATLKQSARPISLEDFLSALSAGTPLPSSAVLVTFDDGDRSIVDRAMPILKDAGVPAVSFVVAGLVGTDTPFWWAEATHCIEHGGEAEGLPGGDPAGAVRALKRLPDTERRQRLEDLRRTSKGPALRTPQLTREEVRELASAGIEIGNHTWSHPCLDRCGDEVLESELTRAHEELSDILGRPPSTFAYPNGNHDPRARRHLTALGYEAAFLFDHRVPPFPPEDRYRISRVRVSSTTHPDRFQILTSGLHSSLHHLLGRP